MPDAICVQPRRTLGDHRLPIRGSGTLIIDGVMREELHWIEPRPVTPCVLLQLRYAAGDRRHGSRRSSRPGEVHAGVLREIEILRCEQEECLNWQTGTAVHFIVVGKEEWIVFRGRIWICDN